LLVLLATGLCTGTTCTFTLHGDDDGIGGSASTGNYVPLDQADATITIAESSDSDQADVTARITQRFGFTVRLQEGQDIAVNGQSLTGPDYEGYYRATVPAASQYIVTVTEPQRGVLNTTIASAGSLEITSPAALAGASLSGFTITWSGANPGLNVLITLTQTLFGDEIEAQFGPFADTGSHTLDYEDLGDFRQGAALLITVTRLREQQTINGFRSGTLTAECSDTVAVTPTP